MRYDIRTEGNREDGDMEAEQRDPRSAQWIEDHGNRRARRSPASRICCAVSGARVSWVACDEAESSPGAGETGVPQNQHESTVGSASVALMRSPEPGSAMCRVIAQVGQRNFPITGF